MIVFDKLAIVGKYLGVPYVHHGRTMAGMDCWGLVIAIYRDLGIEIFDLENYEREWARRGKNLILENYYENWRAVKEKKLGDVVLVRFPKDTVSHAGVVLDSVRFIQAIPQGVVVSTLKSWQDKIHGFYRYVT